MQLLNEELNPCTTGNPAFLTLVDADGQKVRFSVETGAVVSMTSASGKVVHADDYFQSVKNTYDDAGNLVSSYTAVEGLMRTRTGEAGALVMEWYAPTAVTVLEDGGYEVLGSPYKTSSYKSYESEGVRTTVITRQQRGLPAHAITRREEPGRVTITKGTGDDTIIRTIEAKRLYGGIRERMKAPSPWLPRSMNMIPLETLSNRPWHTSIQEREGEVFVPAFDADGNQTLMKTSTGMWKVAYNAANRPVVFTQKGTW